MFVTFDIPMFCMVLVYQDEWFGILSVVSCHQFFFSRFKDKHIYLENMCYEYPKWSNNHSLLFSKASGVARPNWGSYCVGYSVKCLLCQQGHYVVKVAYFQFPMKCYADIQQHELCRSLSENFPGRSGVDAWWHFMISSAMVCLMSSCLHALQPVNFLLCGFVSWLFS